MATDVTMPRLSDSMEEGTVLNWLVEEGGEVKRGEPLVEIETDKANMTYEADTDGTLVEIVAQEGETLPIGEVIARIGDPGEAPSQDGAAASEGEEAEEAAAMAEGGAAAGPAGGAEDGDGAAGEPEQAETAVATGGGERQAPPAERGDGAGADAPDGDGDGRIKASPVARRMAGEKGVDLSSLRGSGPGGRIVKADVLAAAEDGGAAAEAVPRAAEARAEEETATRAPAPEEAPAPPEEAPARAAEPVGREEAGPKGEVEVQELSRLQQTVSRRMAESKATAPDFALQIEVDMSACVELRERLKQVADPAPSYNDMVVKASATALREFPRANGAYRDGRFELYSKVNVGVAVAARDALVVPTIFDAGGKSLGEIARAARELIAKVRDGTITPPELSGGTFTVSNLGMFGIESFTAVINPPQAAILAIGALKKKPVVTDEGEIVARDTMSMTLVCDHRILYGAEGAQFLGRIRELLEQPISLAL